ncbi:MAG: hypothetical protein E6Q97_19175 [Desulfurellales bacterium]|nr:MAG: hypothetical protein E6Q97_19175 [Desulfurellales bacterium]
MNLALTRTGDATLVVGAAAVAYAAASLTWSPGPVLVPAIHLATLVAAFTIGYYWAYTFETVAKIYLGAVGVAWIMWMMAGLLNPNFIGCALAFGIAVAIAIEAWFVVLIFGPMLYLTGSRGAIVAGGIVGLAALWRHSRLASICVALAAIVIALSHRQMGESLFNRIGIWQDAINNLSVWGAGWGSFQTAHAALDIRRNVGNMVAPWAYNDALQLIFELGIGSIFVWFFLAMIFGRAHRIFKFIGIGFVACGLTYSPLWLPVIPQILVFMLGVSHRETTS